MKIEPKRHHYIPQFILKNFCYDENNHLLYFDKKSGKISSEDTRDVFMVKNLYRDEINNADNPTKGDIRRRSTVSVSHGISTPIVRKSAR